MSATIRIDMREKELARYLSDRNPVIENLEIGDALVTFNDITILFERKTLADLSSSIKDGRWHEQKARCMAHCSNSKIAYLIETGGHTYDNMQMGAFISTMFRDGCHIIFTFGPEESAFWIRETADRVEKHPEKFGGVGGGTGGGGEYIDCVKVKKCKRENITEPVCYQLQLAQIPGISAIIAKAIADVYPNLSTLLKALEEGGEGILTKIPLIGKKKAEQITRYLIGK